MNPEMVTASTASGYRRRSAALIYALVAVLIISAIILGVGRLVGAHFELEEQAQGYARAVYIAEAVANYQLFLMSRSELPNRTNPPYPGRIAFSDVPNYDPANPGHINGYDSRLMGSSDAVPFEVTGVHIPGRGQAYVANNGGNGAWSPGQIAQVFAAGTDPITGATRGIFFKAAATGLSDRYRTFALNGISFNNATSSRSISITEGFIGCNSRVTYPNGPPQATPPPDGKFGGCRLGPEGSVPDNTFPGDIPRLTSPVVWPSIAEIVNYLWNGSDVASLTGSAANDNANIFYKANADGQFHPLSEKLGGAAATKLTNAEFSQSDYVDPVSHNPQRTLLLQAKDPTTSGLHHNLFVFSDIQMGPNDVLVLDLRKYSSGTPAEINIIINDSSQPADPVSQPITLTNLAYYRYIGNQAGALGNPAQSYFWFNNTYRALSYAPTLAPDPENPVYRHIPPASTTADYVYSLGGQVNPALAPNSPGVIYQDTGDISLRGIVYGINSHTAADNTAGDIVITGNPNFRIAVNCLVGNHVTLNGALNSVPARIAIKPTSDADNAGLEDVFDPNRYILSYRIISNYTFTDGNIYASRLTDRSKPATVMGSYGEFSR